jgi:hypothetical protein
MRSRRILLVSFLLLTLTVITANAQSQDRDNPTPLSADTIKGAGIGKKVEYFYSFTAGPGEVTVAVDLKANTGATNADVEIFDAESNKVFYLFPNATTQGEHAVKKFTLSSKQQVTLRLALDASADSYTVKLTGAVEFAPAPESLPAGDASTSSSNVEQPQPIQPDATTPIDTSTGKTGKTKNLEKAIDLLKSAGSQFGLPSTGILHIVMKDGTTQDVDLSKVKSASINK